MSGSGLISSDSHVVEPPDLWTTRIARRFRERAPRVQRESDGDWWYIDGKRSMSFLGVQTGDRFHKDATELIISARFEQVRPAAHEEAPAGKPHPFAPKRKSVTLISAEEESEGPQPEITQTVVRLRARDAVTVSRTIYNAFKSSSELLDAGPRGLQGFQVFRVEHDKNGKPLKLRGEQTPRFAMLRSLRPSPFAASTNLPSSSATP